MTVKASSLTKISEVQKRIFAQTRQFLAQRGQTITGSYSHLPTLFFSASAHDVEEKLQQLSIPVFEEETLSDETIGFALQQHLGQGM